MVIRKKQPKAEKNYQFEDNINVIAIARLSTNERQAMNPDTRMEHSIDEQQKKIEDFVKKSSEINQVDHQLIFHGSAYKDSEYINNFTNILKLNKNKIFLFTRVDRCSRKESCFVEWKELCRKFHHKLIFIDDNITYPSDNYATERQLSDLVLTAQQYSDLISKNAKQVAERKRKREPVGYVNTSAFGRSFKRDRIYEIHILLITQRLRSINSVNPIKLTELYELFLNIINVMPIDNKQEKIQFLTQIPIEFLDRNKKNIDFLIEPLTFDEIATLFHGYGITYVDVANESNELPLCTNNSKFLINHPMVPENLYRVVHQRKNKRKWIKFSLTDAVKQFFPTDNDQNIQNYIKKCFVLNPNVQRSQARKDLELNTLLSLPKEWEVPEENVPTDIHLKSAKKYTGKFIHLESQFESFIQKCDSDEEFKKKVSGISDNLNQLFQNLSLSSFNNDEDEDNDDDEDEDNDEDEVDEQVLKVQRRTADSLSSSTSSDFKFCGFCKQILKKEFDFCSNINCGKPQ